MLPVNQASDVQIRVNQLIRNDDISRLEVRMANRLGRLLCAKLADQKRQHFTILLCKKESQNGFIVVDTMVRTKGWWGTNICPTCIIAFFTLQFEVGLTKITTRGCKM